MPSDQKEDAMRKPLVAGLLASTLLAAPALAQTNPAPASPPSNAPAATTGAGSAAGSLNYLLNRGPNQFRASDLIGTTVVGNNNETIGEINDVLMDAQGRVAGVIIGVGGFLGMGEKDVAIPMDALRFDASTNGASNTGTVAAPPVTNPATTTAPNAPNASANNTSVSTPTAPSAISSTGTQTSTSVVNADNDDGVPDRIVLSMSKEQLQAAPTFRDNPGDRSATDASRNPPANTTSPATAPRP
jgi:sporulation protein YlmC with PRC-barrel domain